MPLPTEEEFLLVNKNQDDTIADLVDAVMQHPPDADGRYSQPVYEATWKLVEACKTLEEVYDRRLTDPEEYNVEIDRLRRIGLTIDSDTAETMFSYADIHDPYNILDREKFHLGQVGREQFARNPGSNDWVHFRDLPETTAKALWARDGHKLSFPYGLHPGDDIINSPPTVSAAPAQRERGSEKAVSAGDAEIATKVED
jgi:hypothetical protein